MKKTYKCSDLYTATFEDGALMTGTLGVFDTLADAEKAVSVFNAQPAADVAAMLTADALKRFTCEVECKALGNDGKQYDAIWCPDCGQIYYTIPKKVKVLGYIPQYKEV